MAATDQSNGLAVVHGHATEGIPDVLGTARRVRHAHRSLGIEVDQAHGRGAQRRRASAVHGAGVQLFLDGRGPQGGGVNAVLGVDTAGAEAEHWTAHGLDSRGACEDDEVAPGEAQAVFDLDRHQQGPGLVQVGVVRPTLLRLEAMVPALGAAAPVGDAVGARGVPSQSHKERGVVAKVSGPLLLGMHEELLEIR
eukprot:225470_1